MPKSPATAKIYVDPDRCTGCGICTQVCNPGAISLVGDVAQIDEALCTRCGLCAQECPLGAIVSLEVVAPEESSGSKVSAATMPRSPGALVEHGPVATVRQTEQARRFALSPEPPAAQPQPTSTASSPSRAQMLERALSGLMTVAGWILDRGATRGRAEPLYGRGFSRQRSGGQGRGGGRRARRRSRRFG